MIWIIIALVAMWAIFLIPSMVMTRQQSNEPHDRYAEISAQLSAVQDTTTHTNLRPGLTDRQRQIAIRIAITAAVTLIGSIALQSQLLLGIHLLVDAGALLYAHQLASRPSVQPRDEADQTPHREHISAA